jgi:hypothetical protein
MSYYERMKRYYERRAAEYDDAYWGPEPTTVGTGPASRRSSPR